jgi:hypothetical protein
MACAGKGITITARDFDMHVNSAEQSKAADGLQQYPGSPGGMGMGMGAGGAKRGGAENKVINCRLIFMGIDNIHVMRESWCSLLKLARYRVEDDDEW